MIESKSLKDILPLITEVISEGGEFILYPRGTSMLPLIREGSTGVCLVSAVAPAVSDIILYKRPDGAFVLHRIVGIGSDGYILCGDNQCVFEHGVKKENIIAKVSAIISDGKRTDVSDKNYLKYVKHLPRHRAYIKFKNKIASLLGRGKKNRP